jgi:serine/threonine-protein kinase
MMSWPGTRIWAVAAAVLLAACGGGGVKSVTTSGPTSGGASSTGAFVTYTNDAEGFTIRYPADWEKSEDVEGTVVLFKSPSEGLSDAVRESVGVTTEALPSPSIDIQEYSDAAIDQVKQAIPEFDLISTESTTVAGHPGHRIVYTGKQGSVELQWQQVYTVVGDKAYILTFVAVPDSYSRFVGIAQSIFDTFTVT